MKILEIHDTSLQQIAMSPDGREVSFNFELGSVRCSRVTLFDFQNNFDRDDVDGLPCYIGEVRCETVPGSQIRETLSRLNYEFFDKDGRAYRPEGDSFFHLHIASGEVVIDVVCGEFHSLLP